METLGNAIKTTLVRIIEDSFNRSNPLVVRSRTAFPGHAPARGTLPGQEVEAVGADVLGPAAHVVGDVAVGFALLVPPHAPHLLLTLSLAYVSICHI